MVYLISEGFEGDEPRAFTAKIATESEKTAECVFAKWLKETHPHYKVVNFIKGSSSSIFSGRNDIEPPIGQLTDYRANNEMVEEFLREE